MKNYYILNLRMIQIFYDQIIVKNLFFKTFNFILRIGTFEWIYSWSFMSWNVLTKKMDCVVESSVGVVAAEGLWDKLMAQSSFVFWFIVPSSCNKVYQ